MNQLVQFKPDLIRKYGATGPRYTSYPTALQFGEGFDSAAYRRCADFSNDALIPLPLSLYLHLPFCHSLCYYCGCSKKVTRHTRHGEEYLDRLHAEISMQGQLFDRDREVRQLHFGGGTPTFFDDEQLQALMQQLEWHFGFADETRREFSIEIDPRTVDSERLERLAGMGFNRISIGVQDFDPAVQQAVNRVQDNQAIHRLIEASRELEFASLSLDLIYGLPHQTPASFSATLDEVIEARPDRLSVYNYAHLPQVFRSQRMIEERQLPSAARRLELMQLTISRLTSEGYVYIGMDHFALPDDELSRAQREGRLQRNFQGYSTHRECDLVGLGASAIGRIGDSYSQNIKDIRAWQQTIDDGELPIWRGVVLNAEDRLRREVIESIMCHGALEFSIIESRFDIDFNEHFALELARLEPLARDGLLQLDEECIRATPAGRILLRSIAMVFDAYLQQECQEPRFSKVI